MQHGNSFVDRFGDDKVINTECPTYPTWTILVRSSIWNIVWWKWRRTRLHHQRDTNVVPVSAVPLAQLSTASNKSSHYASPSTKSTTSRVRRPCAKQSSKRVDARHCQRYWPKPLVAPHRQNQSWWIQSMWPWSTKSSPTCWTRSRISLSPSYCHWIESKHYWWVHTSKTDGSSLYFNRSHMNGV